MRKSAGRFGIRYQTETFKEEVPTGCRVWKPCIFIVRRSFAHERTKSVFGRRNQKTKFFVLSFGLCQKRKTETDPVGLVVGNQRYGRAYAVLLLLPGYLPVSGRDCPDGGYPVLESVGVFRLWGKSNLFRAFHCVKPLLSLIHIRRGRRRG